MLYNKDYFCIILILVQQEAPIVCCDESSCNCCEFCSCFCCFLQCLPIVANFLVHSIVRDEDMQLGHIVHNSVIGTSKAPCVLFVQGSTAIVPFSAANQYCEHFCVPIVKQQANETGQGYVPECPSDLCGLQLRVPLHDLSVPSLDTMERSRRLFSWSYH